MAAIRASAALVLTLAVTRCLAQTSDKVEDIGVHFSTTVTESLFGTPTATTAGLSGQIYEIPPDTGLLPKFAKLTPVGTIYTDALYIPPRTFSEGFPGVTNRIEWFAIDYTGSFYIHQPGKYRFVLISDDGAKLYVDGKTVIDNDGLHAVMRQEGEKKLSKGAHRIRVSYFQGPRYQIALVLGVRIPSDAAWRIFNMKEFRPPQQDPVR